MNTLLYLLVLTVAALNVACGRSADHYAITFWSSTGEIVAVGSITFASGLPAEGKSRGSYVLSLKKVVHADKHTEWFYRLIENKERGEVEWHTDPDQLDAFRIIINFTPAMADANIGARVAAFQDGRSEGTWTYGIFSGGYDGGRFEIRRK